MHEQSTTLGIPLSPPRKAEERHGWRQLAGAMRAARDLLLGASYEATVQDIQTAFGCSRRTAERIYAGQYGPEQHIVAIFNPETGGAYVKAALETLPSERRLAVAKAIKDAAELAWLQARQEQLLNEAK